LKRVLLSFALLFAGTRATFGQDISVTGRIELSESKSSNRAVDSSGAVVWLTSIEHSVPIQDHTVERHLQLLQKNKTFAPRLVVVQVGSGVEFPNQDPFFHNVFSLFDGKRFDLGLYESGSTRSVVFNRAGVSYIFCNIHPEMSAVVVALNTPHYGISDRNGLITIPGVPAGIYDMQVWHERVLPENLTGLKKRVQVSASNSSFGVLHLMEHRNFPQAHKNKYGRDYDNSTPNGPAYVSP